MGFELVRYTNFRNLTDTSISFDAPEVFLIGENGQGKSNILESLYLLCYGSSFRTRKEQTLITNGADGGSVYGRMNLADNDSLDIAVRLSARGKDILVDGSAISDRRDIVRNLPCIVFCHDDIRFVTGSPEHRRWFFNQTLSMYSDGFIDTLRRYTRVLRSRNAALKQEQYDLLEAYDPQLAEAGLQLLAARAGAAAEFSEQFARLYHNISGLAEPLHVEYRPAWPVESDIDSVCELLKTRRDTDIRMRTTTSGPHRDRFRFVMNGAEFTETASTGQLRLISLVLRVAQSVFFSRHSPQRPLLLLDDVMLELDPVRRGRFFDSLPEYDQAVFTFLPDEQFSPLRRSDTLLYTVVDGTVYGESG